MQPKNFISIIELAKTLDCDVFFQTNLIIHFEGYNDFNTFCDILGEYGIPHYYNSIHMFISINMRDIFEVSDVVYILNELDF